jgi:hypothetical protein
MRVFLLEAAVVVLLALLPAAELVAKATPSIPPLLSEPAPLPSDAYPGVKIADTSEVAVRWGADADTLLPGSSFGDGIRTFPFKDNGVAITIEQAWGELGLSCVVWGAVSERAEQHSLLATTQPLLTVARRRTDAVLLLACC